jgi:hypothetical protein
VDSSSGKVQFRVKRARAKGVQASHLSWTRPHIGSGIGSMEVTSAEPIHSSIIPDCNRIMLALLCLDEVIGTSIAGRLIWVIILTLLSYHPDSKDRCIIGTYLVHSGDCFDEPRDLCDVLRTRLISGWE